MTEGIDYVVQYQDNVFPGKATIIIVGKGAYAGGSKRASFTIKGIKLAGDVQYNNVPLKNIEYTGENIILPAESIKLDAVEGSNYEGTITGSAVIGQSDLSKAKITVKPGKSYSYLAGSPLVFNSDILEIKVGDKTLTEGEDFVIVGSSYSKNRTKGTATFMIRGVNNYGGYKQLKFTIKPQSIFKKIFNV